MVVKAYAKINWTLDITGCRPDGYHLLDMLMQPVSVHDVISIARSASISLTGSGLPQPLDESNLALRAARLLQAEAGTARGAAIHVDKRIPSRAGMGGGSADAATVLVALDSFWGLGWPLSRLEALGLRLGADVPFCIRGGLARVRGIGEVLSSLPCRTMYELVILRPDTGLGTREVFQAWREPCRRPDTENAYRAIESGNLPLLSQSAANVLQPVAESMCPDIRACVSSLTGAGAALARMTGSGSAVYGVFGGADAADRAYSSLREKYNTVLRCRTQLTGVGTDAGDPAAAPIPGSETS